MKTVVSLILLLTLTTMNDTVFTIDFGKQTGGQDWYVVNDGVMGGLSNSSITFDQESMLFTGNVSLENNGGFASVRSARQLMDLSKYTKVKIRFKSKNKDRIFALRLNTNDVYYRPSYNQDFQSISDDWQELEFNLTDFNETVLGRKTGKTIPTSQLEKVIRIGIMLNDKKEGAFSLEIDAITFS